HFRNLGTGARGGRTVAPRSCWGPHAFQRSVAARDDGRPRISRITRRGRTARHRKRLKNARESVRGAAGCVASTVSASGGDMDLEIGGKVFIVTGASAGIGEATARFLAQEGARVVGVARNPKPIERVHENITAVAEDLTDPDAPRRVVAAAVERYGGLDGLVNNVGALRSRTGFLDTTDADWKATFDLNLHSLVRMTRQVLPVLLERGSGSLVHLASEAARFPDPALVDY